MLSNLLSRWVSLYCPRSTLQPGSSNSIESSKDAEFKVKGESGSPVQYSSPVHLIETSHNIYSTIAWHVLKMLSLF